MSTAIDTVQRMISAWEQLDWDQVTATFSPDGSLTIVPTGQTYQGRSAIRGHLDQVAGAIESLSFDISHFAANDNIVTFERHDVFVYNGKQASVPVVGILTVTENQVSDWREYFDGFTMAKAMGLR